MQGKVKAVDDISLEVRPGEFWSLGPWCWKNNHHQDDYRVLPIDTGTINVNGHDIDKDPISKMSMGYVPDTHDIYDRLTGIEYLNFIAVNMRYPVKNGSRT